MNIQNFFATLLTTLVGIAVVNEKAAAQGSTAWILDSEKRILKIDLSSGVALSSPVLVKSKMEEIAIDSNQLYGTDGQRLYKISESGSTTAIGDHLIDDYISSIEFRGDGTLFGSSTTCLYRIDTATGKATSVFKFDRWFTMQWPVSFAFDTDNYLYMTGFFGGGNVIKIWPNFQAWQKVGETGWAWLLGLVSTLDNKFYCFDSLSASFRAYYELDTSNGSVREIKRDDSIYNILSIDGAAVDHHSTPLAVINPVFIPPNSTNPQGTLGFKLQTKLQKIYVVESTDNLTANVWIPLQWIAGDGKLKDFLQSIKEGIIQIFRIREIPQGFLSFPLAGKTAHNVLINSVFDHSMSDRFCPDNVVVAYTGEFGKIEYGAQREVTLRCSKTDMKNDLFSFQSKERSNFSLRNQYFGGGKPDFLAYDGHPGYDFKTNDKDPDGIINVLAAADGKIIVANKEYGTIGIQHKNGFQTFYLHLSEFYLNNKSYSISEGTSLVGQIIQQGDVIGKSGGTDSNGDDSFPHHLHFEVRKKVSEEYVPVDPYGWESSERDPYFLMNGVENINLWKE